VSIDAEKMKIQKDIIMKEREEANKDL